MTSVRPRAWIVCDLGFGDAGKGLVTDALVRRTGAGLVVRYNGGAQAGHNVVTSEGLHHTFAQLGAGSFVPGVRTFLSRFVVVHPTALLREAEVFDTKTGGDVLARVEVSERARIITPFHQALNRLRELARGRARHGSCGVGVGETVRDALAFPGEALTAGELRDRSRLVARLLRLRDRMVDEARALAQCCDATVEREARAELAMFEVPEVAGRWMEQACRLVSRGCIVADATLRLRCLEAGAVVFEGAQGLLLDEWIGFHPHTTWSDCTPRQALVLLEAFSPELEVVRVGVLRSHAVRHGPGPLPSEADALRAHLEEHNAANPWQGAVRYGWLDAVLTRYALERCGGVDVLALTHLDLLERMEALTVIAAYRERGRGGDPRWSANWQPGREGHVLRTRPDARADGGGEVGEAAVRSGAGLPEPDDGAAALAAQEALGAWLAGGVVPVPSAVRSAEALVQWVERELGVPVGLTSRGATASQVTFRPPLAESLP